MATAQTPVKVMLIAMMPGSRMLLYSPGIYPLPTITLPKMKTNSKRLQESLHKELHRITPRNVSVARQHRKKSFPVQSRRLLPVWCRNRFSRLGSEM